VKIFVGSRRLAGPISASCRSVRSSSGICRHPAGALNGAAVFLVGLSPRSPSTQKLSGHHGYSAACCRWAGLRWQARRDSQNVS